MMRFTSIGIFCGSRSGHNKLYRQHAEMLAKILAENHVSLIYGGGRNGLMGVVADTMMNHGGTVTGIIPELLLQWESQHNAITDLMIVENMHIRKSTIYQMCDAAVVLPGGFGTLDELFEILTWNQLAIHDKKVFLLNSGGFYNHLLQHLQLLTDEGFLYGNLQEQLTVLNSPEDILPFISSYPG